MDERAIHQSSCRSRIQEFLNAHSPLLGFGSMSYQLGGVGHETRIVDCSTQGLTLQGVAKIIESNDPGVVGIATAIPSFHVACQLARIVKAEN